MPFCCWWWGCPYAQPLWPRLAMQGNIARRQMRPLLASTGWEPTTSAAIALHGCSMEPDFPSCLLRQPLCFQL